MLARRAEIGEAAFARGYHLLPVAEGEVLIPAAWLQFWQPPMPACDTIVLAIDPAVSDKQTADASAFVVLGKKGGTVYCLDAVAHRVRLPELLPLVEKADRLWQPDAIWFESNAAFAGIRDLLIESKGFGPKVRGTASRSAKADRLRTLSVRIRRGEFLLMGNGDVVDSTQRELADELTTFPFGEHDDLADAAAMGTEYLFGIPEPRVWVYGEAAQYRSPPPPPPYPPRRHHRLRRHNHRHHLVAGGHRRHHIHLRHHRRRIHLRRRRAAILGAWRYSPSTAGRCIAECSAIRPLYWLRHQSAFRQSRSRASGRFRDPSRLGLWQPSRIARKVRRGRPPCTARANCQRKD